MTGETSAERIEMLALSLEIAKQPETARILRRITAARDAAIARAEAAEAQLELAREALADLIGAGDGMAMAMNSGMADASMRRARVTLGAIEKKEPGRE